MTIPLVTLLLALAGAASAQPVFDYVNAPDDAFKWEVVSRTELPTGGVATRLQMISQVWHGTTWTHRMLLFEPAEMQYPSTAVMLIDYGVPKDENLGLVAMVANGIKAPVAVLGDIPNQPLFDNLREDALIAYTFQNALQSRDFTWPLLYPMAKAAVRAMDTIEQYTAQEWETPVTSFYVTGASKRGWTTWFTGVVAPERLKGIAPMVYDNLNLPAQMRLHKSSWGQYSEQIDDYTVLSLPDLIATEQGAELASIVDPYTYRERATMPKLVIAGTNDRYWPLEAANEYFTDLPEPRYIIYVPNSGHGLQDQMRVLNAQTGFFACCTGRGQLPDIEWEPRHGRHFTLDIRSDIAPVKVLEWSAVSPTRDFRDAEWRYRELRPVNGDPQRYAVRAPYPEEGYRAVFGELVYGVEDHVMPLSTKVTILGPR